jgi:hypothetical protein
LNTTAHVTPLDLSGASFNERPKVYRLFFRFQEALDMDLLCSDTTCAGIPLQSRGYLLANFYRFVNEQVEHWYFINVGNDGSGNPVVSLHRATEGGSELVGEGTATLSEDGLEMLATVPRAEITGQKEGRKIYWDAASTYWEAPGADHCTYTIGLPYENACVDWVPDARYATHVLRN